MLLALSLSFALAAPRAMTVQGAYEAFQQGHADQVAKQLPALIASGSLPKPHLIKALAVLAAAQQVTGAVPVARKTVDQLLTEAPDYQAPPGVFPPFFGRLLEARRAALAQTAPATTATASTSSAPTAPGATPTTRPAAPPSPAPSAPAAAVPSSVAAPPAAPAAMAAAAAAPPEAPHFKAAVITRVAVLDPRVDGDPSSNKAVAAWTQATVAELNKLMGLQIISMADLREMLGFERQRQLMGCEPESQSCLTELAGSAGADELLIAQVAYVGKTVTVTTKRLSMKTGSALQSDTRTIDKGSGEELLALVGEQVKVIFPERELKAGKTRGVDKETLARLVPPPLPRWVCLSLAGAALASGGAGAFYGLQSQGAQSAYAAKMAQAVTTPQPASDLAALQSQGQQAARLANTLFIAGGALAVGAVATSFLTNWSPAEPRLAIAPLPGGAAVAFGGTF